MSEYTIRGGSEGRSRLSLLSELLHVDTTALFDTVGVAPGSRCLDVGCGGGHLTFDLARRVGPSGRVVGLDLDGDILELARLDAKDQGLDHVEFRCGDARTLDGAAAYDVVHCRFVLSHLPHPEELVASMANLLAPGGLLVLVDVDFNRVFWYPESPALRQASDIYVKTVRRRGGDACLGPRLPALLRDAGLNDVRARVAQPLSYDRALPEMYAWTLEMMADAIVGEGVAARDDIDAVAAAVRDVGREGTTLVAFPMVVQAWGRARR